MDEDRVGAYCSAPLICAVVEAVVGSVRLDASSKCPKSKRVAVVRVLR